MESDNKLIKSKIMKKKPSEKSKFGIYLLYFTIVVYLITLIVNSITFKDSLSKFGDLFIQVIPTIIFMLLIMIITDFFLSGDKLKHLLERINGFRAWILFGIAGIISSGPIYVWYPYLSNLLKDGIRPGYLIVFLYNRAIKFPQIPIMLMVFSIEYISILFVVMFFASIIQGILGEKLIQKWED